MRHYYVPSRFVSKISLQLNTFSPTCQKIYSSPLSSQILKPAEKKAKYPYGGMNMGRPVTPPRKQKKKDNNKMG
jgi:hypothetical protein